MPYDQDGWKSPANLPGTGIEQGPRNVPYTGYVPWWEKPQTTATPYCQPQQPQWGQPQMGTGGFNPWQMPQQQPPVGAGGFDPQSMNSGRGQYGQPGQQLRQPTPVDARHSWYGPNWAPPKQTDFSNSPFRLPDGYGPDGYPIGFDPDADYKKYGVPPQFWPSNQRTLNDFNSPDALNAWRNQKNQAWDQYLSTVSPEIRNILQPPIMDGPGSWGQPPGQPPIGLPPLPPGQQPPIGLPPQPPPWYQGYGVGKQDNFMPGELPPGQQPPIGLPPLPPPGYIGDNVMNPVPGQYGQPIGGNTTLPYPTPNPAQLNIPPQYQGSMLRSGAGTTTPQKRIPKGSMYGGMERL